VVKVIVFLVLLQAAGVGMILAALNINGVNLLQVHQQLACVLLLHQ
jgi:hypothetical protein